MLISVTCSNCGKPLLRKPCYVKKNKFFFCNKTCQDLAHTNGRINYKTGPKPRSDQKHCLVCEKPIAKNENKYCSKNCYYESIKSSNTESKEKFIEAWLNNEIHVRKISASLNRTNVPDFLRDFLIHSVGNKCEECGYSDTLNPHTNRSILQIHHIDGDSFNSIRSNLQILCPNCHAKTSNFCRLNTRKNKIRAAQ